jgi:hypothetical protein
MSSRAIIAKRKRKGKAKVGATVTKAETTDGTTESIASYSAGTIEEPRNGMAEI